MTRIAYCIYNNDLPQGMTNTIIDCCPRQDSARETGVSMRCVPKQEFGNEVTEGTR